MFNAKFSNQFGSSQLTPLPQYGHPSPTAVRPALSPLDGTSLSSTRFPHRELRCTQPVADLPGGGRAHSEEAMRIRQELPSPMLSEVGRLGAVSQHPSQEGTRHASDDSAVRGHLVPWGSGWGLRTRLVDHGRHAWELPGVGYHLPTAPAIREESVFFLHPPKAFCSTSTSATLVNNNKNESIDL